jgi:CheY-like chemotaxis protein
VLAAQASRRRVQPNLSVASTWPTQRKSFYRLFSKNPPRGCSMSSILIVEDDVLASEYLEFVLDEAGYEAVPATSSEEAIAVLQHRDDVHLVVTDINLPGGLNGLQLAALVRSRWPSINIIVVTGYGPPKSEDIPSGEPTHSKAVQRPKNDRGSASFPTLTSLSPATWPQST